MDALIPYTIPIKGLRYGLHQFDFYIDGSFFQPFEASPVSEGNIHLSLQLEKKSDLYILQFDFEGTVRTECDRCLAMINLPIQDSQRLLVKLHESEVAEEADVIFIHPEEQQLDVSKYVYEYIILAIPASKVYDCVSEEYRPCNFEILRYLENIVPEAAEEPETKENPMWNALKDLDINDN